MTSVSSASYPIQSEVSQDFHVVKFSQTNTQLDRDIQLSGQRSNTILAYESKIFISASTKVGTCETMVFRKVLLFSTKNQTFARSNMLIVHEYFHF